MKKEKCKCRPCKTCGYKHGCNINQTHPGGWYRSVGSCPAKKFQWEKIK